MFQAEETGSGGKSGSKSTEERKNKIHSGHRRKLSEMELHQGKSPPNPHPTPQARPTLQEV